MRQGSFDTQGKEGVYMLYSALMFLLPDLWRLLWVFQNAWSRTILDLIRG
jgi:hypothetical protein